MSTPPSPPSPISPSTPPEVYWNRYLEEVKIEEGRKRKNDLINLVTCYLTNFFNEDKYMMTLLHVINKTETSLEKRYKIAMVINNTLADINIEDTGARSQVKNQLVNDAFQSDTDLYQALNTHSNWMGISFFGEKAVMSFESKSLQIVQSTAIKLGL